MIIIEIKEDLDYHLVIKYMYQNNMVILKMTINYAFINHIVSFMIIILE